MPLEPRKIKSAIVSTSSPSICHEVMGPDAVTLAFWMLSFKPAFSLSSFTLIKRLFSSSSLSAIRVVSSAYLRLLIFLPAILIPACDSFSPAFHMQRASVLVRTVGARSSLAQIRACGLRQRSGVFFPPRAYPANPAVFI